MTRAARAPEPPDRAAPEPPERTGPVDRTDLTRGPVLRRTLAYALPVAVTNLLQQTYLLVDTAVVGHLLGRPGMAAVGVSQGLVYVLSAGSFGIGGAFAIRLGQLKGAGRDTRATLRALALSTVAWALVCLVLTLGLAGPALAAMGAEGQLADDARRFLTTLGCGLVAVFALGSVTAVHAGRGDSRTAMLLLASSNVLNAALVWLFVGPLGLGLEGAALATIAASGLAAVVGLRGLTRTRGRPDARADVGGVRAELRAGLSLGAPITAQHLVIALGATLLLGIVTTSGTAVLAGVTVVVRLETFAALAFIALASGLSATVAQNAGAGQPDRIRTALTGCVRLTAGLGVVVSAVLVLCRDLVATLFVADPAVAEVISRYVAITYPFFTCYLLMVVVHGYLTGLGRTAVPLVCTVLSFAVVRLPLSAVWSDRYGLDGLIWAVVVGWVVGLAYTVLAVLPGGRRPGRPRGPDRRPLAVEAREATPA
ncbi:MATE family efflux transporter [Cellulomonas shaoxiangyii]|uniref:MATE family efflux transporter n=1 Tax=Cellulomonas shaoxiangyii TaxID=2566013 RepID=UPI0014073FC9|nr:MATE family efflux transporter [Cellulomonas shaoxiangyii]